jgi:hypothetical protein
VTGDVEIDRNAIVSRPRSRGHADADPVVDRAADAEQGAPVPAGAEVMFRLLTPSDRRSCSKASPRPERVATELASSSAWKGDRLPEDC